MSGDWASIPPKAVLSESPPLPATDPPPAPSTRGTLRPGTVTTLVLFFFFNLARAGSSKAGATMHSTKRLARKPAHSSVNVKFVPITPPKAESGSQA